MCIMQGDDRGLIPWWYERLKSLKRKPSKVWTQPAISNVCCRNFCNSFSFDLLFYSTTQSDWLWLWDQNMDSKKGFLNYTLWKKDQDLISSLQWRRRRLGVYFSSSLGRPMELPINPRLGLILIACFTCCTPRVVWVIFIKLTFL